MAESDYDIPLDDYGTPYVTIEEMIELLKNQKKQYEELQQDEQTGLYFTDYFGRYNNNMLQDHLLIEQCMEHIDELDWARITNGYSLHIIPYLQHLWGNPLVWVDEIPSELARQFVVTGRVAEEKSSEERNTCMPYDSLAIELQHERTLWFADNLPTRNTIYSYDYYWKTPSDIPLWNLLLTDPYELFCVELHKSNEDPHTGRKYWPYCNAEHFRFQIEYIRTNRSEQKAAQIVRLLREDWPDIKAMKLFGVDRCTPEQVDEFEQCLFAGMDRNLRKWEAATAPKVEPQDPQTQQEPAINLESVFSLRFRRTDEYNRLLHFLESERTEASDPDWARYALALYEANILVHRPAGFTKWLPRFCQLFGRQVAYREPSSLRRTPCQKDITAYLPSW